MKVKQSVLTLLSTMLILGNLSISAQQESISESNGEHPQISLVSTTEQEEVNTYDKESYLELEALFKESPYYKVGNSLYQLEQPLATNEQNYTLTVNMMKIYEVDQLKEEVKSEFDFQNGKGALIVLHVKIENKTQESFYYPIEALDLTYLNATSQTQPSLALYPADSGNLALTLSDTQGEIVAGETVEGYLVYGLGSEALATAKETGYVFLTVVPPKRQKSDISGVGANALGDEQSLYLPLDKAYEAKLLVNATHLRDRLTTEYWGDKAILADEKINKTNTNSGVSITLDQVEVSEFTPHDYNEDAFRNFKYGAVIVSIAYTVKNQTNTTLLPVDSKAQLIINADPINSDYVLTNQVKGKELKPGQTFKVIQSFALDKKRYQEKWQGHDYQLQITVPEKGPDIDSGTLPESASESSESTNAQNQPAKEPQQFPIQFEFSPKLKQLYDAELKLKQS